MRTLLILPASIAYLAIVLSSAAVRSDEPRASTAQSSSPAKEFFPQPTDREARLDAALDQRLSIAFQEMPLKDVAAWFGSKLEAPVILNDRSLQDAGISGDTPVTRTVENISARAALKLVLDDLDLASLQQDGVLVIVTQDTAESNLFTRVYPVGDLTPLVPRVFPVQPKGGTKPSGGGMFQVQGEAKPATSEAQPEKAKKPSATTETRMVADYDALIEVITTTAKPQSWDEVGGPGSISPMSSAQSIVVSQTREVHEEVLELLRALRAAKQAGTVVAPDNGQ